jgi:hypothetical protein
MLGSSEQFVIGGIINNLNILVYDEYSEHYFIENDEMMSLFL